MKNRKKEKKLRPLRRTVLRPLLITTSVISAAIVIFFNAVMLLILYTDAVSEARSVAGVVEKMSDSGEVSRSELINLYNAELERRNLGAEISLITLKDSEVVYSSLSLAPERLELLSRKISEESGKNDPTFQVEGERDIVVVCPVNAEIEGNERGYICASLRSIFSSLKRANEILLIIIAISAVALIIASHIIADNISKPIKELSDHMEVIGDGDFSHVRVSENSTELHKLTANINDMLTKLQAYNDAHTVSLQNLSHDLRTPLMSISGYAEGIKYGVIERETAADVIISESKKLTGVVEKILILSELDTLNQPINMIPINLFDFLNGEIERIDGYAMSRRVTIRIGTENRSFTVLADRQLLSTIVQNLLSNAIRYAEEFVDIKAFEQDGKISVSVRDDGAGLSEKDMEHLFARYYVGETGHSGLGLSAAKSSAEYMGCTIRGENSPHGGAIFTVTFPVFQD